MIKYFDFESSLEELDNKIIELNNKNINNGALDKVTNKRKALEQLERIAFNVIAQTKYPKSFSEKTYEDANALYKSNVTWDKDKKSHHKWFRERIGAVKITDLTAIKIKALQDEYKQSVGSDTVNRRFTHLSSVLNTCKDYGLLKDKPYIKRLATEHWNG